MMLFADMGTQYTKILDSLTGEYRIIRSMDWTPDLVADVACGHNCKHKTKHEVNELVALAKGAKRLIEEPTFILVDVGSRDIKSVKFENGEYVGCDWNYMCGAMAGFTIELLGNHFGINYNNMEVVQERLSIVCGILGMGELFDRIADGIPPEKAIAMFIKGIAKNIHDFSGKANKLYLAGGLCENKLFINSFACEIVPLGRFVQVEGLKIKDC